MTQKIFDTDNEEDMDLLWSILPEETDRITRNDKIWDCIYVGEGTFRSLLKIDWHDKTEITRPVNYEDMIGCVGWFWNGKGLLKYLGILARYDAEDIYSYVTEQGDTYEHFRPAKKSELKFYGD